MARIRAKGSKPEMMVRRLVHRLGYRFRLHRKDLPGTPDLVFPGKRKIIFVHGCFWHQHSGCKLARMPKSKVDFWGPKLALNRSRDAKHLSELEKLGWDVLVLWECELGEETMLTERIDAHLGETEKEHETC